MYNYIKNFKIQSESAIHLALNGIDVLNGLLLSINTYHKDLIDSQKEDFVKLTLLYSNFVLGSCFQYNKTKYSYLCYKKIQNIFKRVIYLKIIYLELFKLVY